MYYVPEGTKKCGYYQCERCGVKFLSLQTMNTIDCTYCAEEIDMDMGPGEDVEKMDTLLSLAITGGNYDWI